MSPGGSREPLLGATGTNIQGDGYVLLLWVWTSSSWNWPSSASCLTSSKYSVSRDLFLFARWLLALLNYLPRPLSFLLQLSLSWKIRVTKQMALEAQGERKYPQWLIIKGDYWNRIWYIAVPECTDLLNWINLLIGDGFFSGFACFYKRRTGTKTDGCAVCYKHSRFQLISLSPVEYFRPGLDILNRDNVGLVLLLQPVLPEDLGLKTVSPLCVANTHVLFNPRRGDIKLAQVALLLAEIDKIARTTEGSYYPVILCGDLNSVPDSPLYKFIRNGELSYHGMPAWKVVSSQSWDWMGLYCMLLEKCMAAFFILWGNSFS